MGFYTWSFANKPLVINRDGEVSVHCKLPYDGFGRLLLPDGSSISEISYEGYGMFDGYDVFELLADWNKNAIPALVASGTMDDAWENINIQPIALAWADGEQVAFRRALDAIKDSTWYFETDWKRFVGIWLNSVSQKIPFPIKIVSTRCKRYDYGALPASVQCQ